MDAGLEGLAAQERCLYPLLQEKPGQAHPTQADLEFASNSGSQGGDSSPIIIQIMQNDKMNKGFPMWSLFCFFSCQRGSLHLGLIRAEHFPLTKRGHYLVGSYI